MTSPFTNFRSDKKDTQESTKRGVWGERTDVENAGSIMSVRGTGTVDQELPVVNFGYSFNLPINSDAEVIMLSLGADVNDKVALPMLPRNAQRQWPLGSGGVQHPSDKERYLEFNEEETYLRDGKFVLGTNREVTITVDGTNVTIQTSGKATLQADSVDILAAGAVAITSGSLTHNGKNIGDTHIHPGDSGGLTGVPV